MRTAGSFGPGQVTRRRRAPDPMRGPTLASRLVAVFAATGVALGAVGLGAGIILHVATTQQRRLATEITPALETNRQVRATVVDLDHGAELFETYSDRSGLRGAAAKHQQAQNDLAEIHQLTADPALRALLAEQRTALTGWYEQAVAPAVEASAVAHPGGTGTDAAGAAPQATGGDRSAPVQPAATAQQVLRANDAVVGRLVNERARLRADADRSRQIGLLILSLATVLAVSVLSVAGQRTVAWFSRPLSDVVQGLQRLRIGDLSQRLEPTGPREVRLVAAALNHLSDQTALLQALREESSRLRRGTLDGALAVREKIDWTEVVGTGLRAIARTLEVDAAWLHQLAQGELTECVAWWAEPTFAAVVDVDAVIAGQPIPLEPRQLTDMWSDGLVHVTQDVDWVPHQPGLVEGAQDGFTPGTVIRVPLVAGEEVMGYIALLDTRGSRSLSSEEVSALLVMASNTAVGLQHSRMFAAQGELVQQLRELDRQKTTFLSNISHELRTPLTSIAGYTEMIADGDAGPVGESMQGMLAAIDRNTHRLSLLIEDLLTMTKIEAAAYRMVTAPVSAETVVHNVVETIRPQTAAAQLDVVVELGNRSLTVLGDQGQLERGLLNLVSNAVKFTPASGTVTIRAEEVDPPVERPAVRRHLGDEPPGKLHQGGWLQLSVTDTGIGIPAADLDRLFDRFFRASNAVENEIPGTGLGLAIARGIVEHHGGRLEVASELGRGTSMSLLLPLVADPSDCPAGRSPAPAEHVPAPRGAAGDGAEPALPGRSSASSSIEASSAIEVRTPDGM